ncbi:hypothetical protein Aperf_G00000027449 [Anoplocephala perfoliata]
MVVLSVRRPLNIPEGTLRGSTDSFKMECGVRQSSRKGPLLSSDLGINLLLVRRLCTSNDKKDGESWNLSHLEYADDLCLLAPSIATASKILTKLIETLHRYQTEDKSVWLCVGTEECPATLEAAGLSFTRTAEVNFLGSTIIDNGSLCISSSQITVLREYSPQPSLPSVFLSGTLNSVGG